MKKIILYLIILFIILIIVYTNNYFDTYDNIDKSDIYIVYFIYINPNRNWKLILEGQMNDLNNTEILQNNKLFVCIDSADENNTNEAKSIVNTILNKYTTNISFSIETENYYEYHGIKKVYDLACLNKDKLFIYFHSKGMVYHNSVARNSYEMILTKYTFYNWNDILNVFKNNKNIEKAGLFPSTDGFVWFNFWWARGDYISKLDKPIINTDRYYYESWLKTPNYKECNDSYSIIYNNIQCFTQDNVFKNINIM